MGSVSALRWGAETPAQLGPLEKADLTEFPKRCVFSFVEYLTMDKVPPKLILNILRGDLWPQTVMTGLYVKYRCHLRSSPSRFVCIIDV
jgi:hypothetical protein